MNVKTYVFFLMVLGYTSSNAQKGGNLNITLQNLKIPNSIKTQAMTAYQAISDDCWDGTGDVTKDCTDLKDPWDKEPSLPPAPPFPGDTSQRIMAFYNFERSIADGLGGKEFKASLVADAWRMSPGFSLKAMKARVRYYNDNLIK